MVVFAKPWRIMAGMLQVGVAMKEHDNAVDRSSLNRECLQFRAKRQIIEKLTDAMVSIEGENMRGVTWVKISEVSSGEWGIGGQPLTTQAVKDLAAGRKAA
jgi:4-oxalocrotonate tautomerase